MELLKRLSETAGVPGHEGAVREVLREALAESTSTIETDHLGNLIARCGGSGPSVTIAAHMDEIGFLVRHVEKETGFVRLEPLGGFDPRVLVAQRVSIHAEGGPLVGCVGSKPVHALATEDRKKPLELKDLFVDVGMCGESVRERVVIGDPITLRQEFLTYGDIVSGKALDDRVGIYIGVEAIRRSERIACDLTFVGTTQEEVGLRGARVAGYASKPEIGIALDVTLAMDVPGVEEAERVTRLGEGVAIKLKDSASISHPGLVRAMRRLAEEREIPYQMEILPRGGTDAGALQMANEGAAVVTLSVPTRYVHSVVETAHRNDIEAAIALLSAFLENADRIDLST